MTDDSKLRALKVFLRAYAILLRSALRIAIALIALTTTNGLLRGQVLPPVPHIIPKTCPTECCRLGAWSTTFSTVALYRAPGDQGPAFDSIPRQTSFTADSSVVVVRQLGVATADRPVPQRYRESPALASGDTVYLLYYEGEDWFRAMVHGQARPVYAFWAGQPGMSRPASWPTFGRALQDLVTEWWAHVRLAERTSGWINMTHVGSVRGTDACSVGSQSARPQKKRHSPTAAHRRFT